MILKVGVEAIVGMEVEIKVKARATKVAEVIAIIKAEAEELIMIWAEAEEAKKLVTEMETEFPTI